MRRGRKIAWYLLLGWTILTAIALTVPIDGMPRVVGRGFDKVVHTTLFTIMGSLAQAATPWYSLLVALPIAIVMEYVQTRLPHRTYDRVELAANIVGVLLGIGCYEIAVRLGGRVPSDGRMRSSGTRTT